jgi:plastocyanin
MYARISLIAAATALVATSAASAATKQVSMGLPHVAAAKAFQKANADALDFFPHVVTVNAGDTVKFVPSGFHSVNVPAKGARPYELLLPGDPVAGSKDAAGADFWFNGQPAFGFNPKLFGASNFGKSFTYTGAKTVESGAPLTDKPKPMSVKFAKAGTYTYYCDIHPGMKGTVKVLPKGAKAPSARSDAKTVAAQLKRDAGQLKRLQAFKPGSGVVQIGNAAKYGVESYDFFPAKTSVKVGTTVTFQMPAASFEVHSATTGPGNPESEPDSYLGKLAGSFNGPAPDPAAFYPSDQPGGTPASLTSSLHGNGFWNSGVMDSIAASPLAQSNKVTFDAPGTYSFYCMIHPFMKATVTVTS